MFFDNVGSRYVTLDNVRTVAILWQRVRVEWTWKFLESLPKLGNRPPHPALHRLNDRSSAKAAIPAQRDLMLPERNNWG